MKPADQRITLQNTNNGVYTGKLYMGTGRVGLNMVWDTYYDWTLAKSSAYSTSTSVTYTKFNDITLTYLYDGTKITGSSGKDTVCATSSALTCATNFVWVGVTSWTHVEADGVVGLSPVRMQTGAVLLLDDLYTQNLISSKVFGFMLDVLPNPSYLDIGELRTASSLGTG